MRSVGKVTPLVVALGVGCSLAACGHPPETKPTNSPDARPPSSAGSLKAPAAAYDISHVDRINNDFPPGFLVVAQSARQLNPQDISGSAIAELTEARIVPPKCRSMIIPPYAETSAGTEAASVTAAGTQGMIQVVALRSPRPIPPGPPPEGCGLGVVVSGSPDVAGPAERVHPPDIAGVATTGVKLSPAQQNPKYVYTAALDDQTFIIITGGADPPLNPRQLMSDLLTKAVAAVRGR